MGSVPTSPSASRRSLSPPPYSPTRLPLTTDHNIRQSHMSGTDPPSVNQSPAESSRRTHLQPSSPSASTVSSATDDPSTAPTTPALDAPRTWRPTSNVPLYMSQRRARHVAGDEDEERNRWLSDGEGLDGVARSIGRRSRRAHGRDRDRPSYSPGPSQGPASGAETPPQAKARQPTQLNKMARPANRRSRSFEPSAAGPSTVQASEPDSSMYAAPPRIEDLVPSAVVGLGVTTGGASSGIEHFKESGNVPDFVAGHGGDGIGGVSLPSSRPSAEFSATEPQPREAQRELVQKLRRVLGW
ncbi:hypothetical protein BCR39DRAFT_364147 [Naematelia encephala]|uniref:Uncharacterized protein n=1 Tax=Naematelia encephala TaxID=71784 RepID=A0A1Y2AKV7_9TREE|nr:hypothetical protein BCR39DRAFT_364147 [Naematelia encephala]